MAKVITYKFVSAEVNHGTEENPIIEQIFLNKSIICSTQAQYDTNYPIAEKEAVVGSITIEGEFDEESIEPTLLDKLEAQTYYTAMMTDTLLEV